MRPNEQKIYSIFLSHNLVAIPQKYFEHILRYFVHELYLFWMKKFTRAHAASIKRVW